MAKIINTRIDGLIPENKNFNKGTEYGQHLIEESLRKFGAGRSVLLDKNNRIIAGNKTIENASVVGIEDVIIVETTGNQIVAVKRTDIDLDSDRGRELALADNATGKANLSFDYEMISEQAALFAIDPGDWGITMDDPDEDSEEDEPKKVIDTRLIVECGDPMKLSDLFSELQDRGFKCDLKE